VFFPQFLSGAVEFTKNGAQDGDPGLVMQFIKNLARKSALLSRIERMRLISEQYLAPSGYWHSYPADSNGNAVPWFTYPAIQFLNGVVQPSWKVFEYGSGYSTVFWNARCALTVSVEHDESWFNHLKALHPEFDVRLVKEGFDVSRGYLEDLVARFEAESFELPTLPDRQSNIDHGLLNREFANYAAQVTEFPKGFFDVIVVDGMARCLCLYAAAEYIADEGVIVLDNSDRWQYNDLQDYLVRSKGFKRIDFDGLGPLRAAGWITSIFFKSAAFPICVETRRDRGSGDLG